MEYRSRQEWGRIYLNLFVYSQFVWLLQADIYLWDNFQTNTAQILQLKRQKAYAKSDHGLESKRIWFTQTQEGANHALPIFKTVINVFHNVNQSRQGWLSLNEPMLTIRQQSINFLVAK